MNTTRRHEVETIHGRKPTTPRKAGLGEIIVQRDALQARARAQTLLFVIRAIRRGIAAARPDRAPH
jgi:hypothetical protein